MTDPTSPLYKAAKHVVQRLQDNGFTTYFAGGCVRDALLKITAKDYDIATIAQAPEILRLFPHAQLVGAHFGVLIVKEGGYAFEVATFRKDGCYNDHRRPENVLFSSPEEDAQRRDFTVNGMFYDPIKDVLIDFVNGRHDLEMGTIRAIGVPVQRFQEDALRLMRAIRFTTRTNFQIEPETWSALCDHADLIQKISVERVRDEFSKILTHQNRAIGLQLLVDSGLITSITPEVVDLIGCEQPPQWHPEGDVYTHTKIALSLLPHDASLELCLAVLLHDIGKPATAQWDEAAQRIRFNGHDMVGADMAETILKRLRYPNTTIKHVKEMVSYHMRFMNVKEMRTSKLKRFIARDTFQEELELHRVDCASSNGFTENYDYLQDKLVEFANAPIVPAPLITGNDLLQLGIPASPLFREILEEIQTEQLEQRLSDRTAALIYVREKFLAK